MPVVAPAEAGQHLVADGAAWRADVVDLDVAADQGREVAAPRAPSGRSVTSTAIRSIETRPTSGQRLPATITSAAGLLLVGAGRAQIAVGVADRDDRDAGSAAAR